ncbi:hypothetical protein FQV27_13665 [Paracoccus aurantiacus]|uniref:Peptidase inhibitor I78 n=1 Tax=Paracoccus aurantiacus TaxID=2599412 RepID=A0A5C6S1G4_9RHOB|nr:I78 family peptidase inhibitor [Paracoccus aurantiacus]TXB68223.1 hypothetical protein FQV27_13665 [Paracoccus aurantiacus]
MLLRLAAPLAALALLGACTEEELAGATSVPPPSDACGAAGLQVLVGKPLGAIDVKSLPSAPRQIGPDMAVTADYQPDRLNVEYNGSNIITKVACY